MLLVEPHDPDALAAAISRLLTDHPYDDLIGRQGRDVVRAKFCLDHMVRGQRDFARRARPVREGLQRRSDW